MDLNNIGEAEDRISELPDSLLHRILSFLDNKEVACTSVLSKRWSHIWTSIPTLVFPNLYHKSEINKFMDFVDRTLRLRDASSNIQKIHIYMKQHFNASRVHSWISNITGRNVEKLDLWLNQREPFLIPSSLFTCESLITFELIAYFIPLSIPKSFSLPKLKSLTLCGFHFIDDCWNQQHISNCPVLENLILDLNWFGVRNFCISTPVLKYLEIDHGVIEDDDGLQNCVLKINAPNLASLTYRGCVAKEYVLSSFQSLESAEVWL
ncbi:F-box/LRR-repeat protein At4g14103-like [Papaver somniferum]|uniref:F-box/LRR-repeat protein At4g14103-like n=1 Tax=Papaver somniferum TaxID=3469 RepID=UPI000E6F84B6|nr:F-box/LRR-repeat protein At4g14103-like [Papaver somniferum]